MTLISCAHMRLDIDTCWILCYHSDGKKFDRCEKLWEEGLCPCKEEIIV